MKTKKYFVLLLITVLTMHACDLPLQESFSYNGEAINLETGMTALEWIESRPDKFSWMKEAIEHAEMSSYYSQDSIKYTFLIIEDQALERWANSKGGLRITDLDKKLVSNFLKYHTILGQYAVYDKQCPIEPAFVKTLLSGEDGLLTLNCSKSSFPIYNAADGPVITSGNIIINALHSNGASPQKSSTTTNIMTTNGVIHTFSDYSFYKRDVNYIPIF